MNSSRYTVVDAHSQSYQEPKFFRDVFLFGREGIPLQGDLVINRFANFGDNQLLIWLMHHQNAKLTSIEGVTLPLYGDWSSNFWHWCYEALPVALAARDSGFSGTYLVPPIPFVIDTLQYIGIPPGRIRCDDGSDYHLECMCLLGKRPYYHQANQKAMREFREMVRGRFASSSPPEHRVYISRNANPQNTRKIVNEDELLELLNLYGFTTLHLEHLPLEEQLRYTCNASALVGPHGAGMAHCAFLPERALVLEHFSPSYINPCCLSTCRQLQHRYFQVTSFARHGGFPHGQDMVAHLEIIQMTLERELR